MTLVIPGVEVRVVKEVVAPQLSPSGVLGLVGVTEKDPGGARSVQSWSRLVELFGQASAFSLPEAAQALQNGVSELVVSPVSADAAVAASVAIPAETGTAFTLHARAGGCWANGLEVGIASRSVLDRPVLDILVTRGADTIEALRGLPADPDAPPLAELVAARSALLTATEATAPPRPGTYTLGGGRDAGRDDYARALGLLESEPDVDMVLAGVQDFADPKRVAQIYSDVIAHCARMSAGSRGRIGFGQVPPSGAPQQWAEMANQLLSERFVLLAPNGVAGAVAGMVGGLDYFQSPTFKAIAGVPDLPRRLYVEEQEALLKASVVPVAAMRGRGTVVVRGLTTDGDQISVRRVADRAVRGVRLISDLFIGRLNNETGRGALREKLVEFLVQMERDGAIVPSTDRSDPAFKVNVHSSQDDFVKGIVRVDMAVRPVRAIDYIYATVLVQT